MKNLLRGFVTISVIIYCIKCVHCDVNNNEVSEAENVSIEEKVDDLSVKREKRHSAYYASDESSYSPSNYYPSKYASSSSSSSSSSSKESNRRHYYPESSNSWNNYYPSYSSSGGSSSGWNNKWPSSSSSYYNGYRKPVYYYPPQPVPPPAPVTPIGILKSIISRHDGPLKYPGYNAPKQPYQKPRPTKKRLFVANVWG